MSFVHGATGDLKRAREEVDEVFRVLRQCEYPAALPILTRALQLRGNLASWQGEHATSIASWKELVEIGRQYQLAPMVAQGVGWLGAGYCQLGYRWRIRGGWTAEGADRQNRL
jgi:hypothetical protein